MNPSTNTVFPWGKNLQFLQWCLHTEELMWSNYWRHPWGDTVEHLLQEKDLILLKAVQLCQAQEAAKKERPTIQQGPSHLHKSMTALKTHPQKKTFRPHPVCPAVGASHIQQVAHNVLHIVYHVTITKRWATFQESAVLNPSNLSDHGPPPPVFNLHSKIAFLNKQVCLNIHHVTSTDPAPKLLLPLMEPPP